MAKKDTQEVEPVSLDDEIAAAYDAASEPEEVEETEEVAEVEEVEEEETETEEVEATTEPEDVDEEPEEPDDSDKPGDGEEPEPEEVEEALTAPEHWAAEDRAKFESVPREAQEFLLKRHKDMEGDYTRKSQQLSNDVRSYGSIKETLAPFRQEFAAAGLDEVGAVRKLASFHESLKTGDRNTILGIAGMYGIDMAEPDDDEYVDPTIQQIKASQKELERTLNQQRQEAQRTEQDRINGMIQSFREATDGEGKPLHPHFEQLEPEMTAMLNSKMATSLEDAYSKAKLLRPDLQAQKRPAPTRADQAEKVKKAKRAATGVKSSGAVGKKPRREMTLEEEIASHMS